MEDRYFKVFLRINAEQMRSINTFLFTYLSQLEVDTQASIRSEGFRMFAPTLSESKPPINLSKSNSLTPSYLSPYQQQQQTLLSNHLDSAYQVEATERDSE